MTQYDLNLREYWWIFKKRKFVVIFIAILLGFFSTAFAILKAPEPIYVSISKIKFEKETPVDGLMAKTITWANGDDILTQTSMIKSYTVLQEVARKLGLIPDKEKKLNGRMKNRVIGIVENLQSKVKVIREGFTNILHIEVTDNSPVFAQRLANTIAESYKALHSEEQMRRTTEAIKYIGDRLKDVRQKLRESENAFNRFSQDNQLIAIDLQGENLLARAQEIRKLIRELQDEKDEFQGILVRLHAFIKKPTRTDVDFYSTTARSQYQSSNDKLIGLVIRKDILLKTYTAKHPEVQAVNNQIIGHARKMTSLLQIHIKDIEKKASAAKIELQRIDRMANALMDKRLELNRLKRNVDMHKEMTILLEHKNEEALIRRAEKPEEITIIKPAMLPSMPINPPKTATTGAIGVLIGALLGLVTAFIIETFDTSLGAIEDVEEALGNQVLGVVPHADVKDIREALKEKFPDKVQEHAIEEAANLISHFVPKSMMSESFRSLRTNIQFKDVEKKLKTISIASTTLQEGKTMVAINLAITMAQGGMKVLLVGCDLRKPMVAKRLGLERTPGLTDILLGNYAWRDTVKGLTDIIMGKMTMEEVMLTPGMDNLHIITSGAIPPNPADLVGSEHMLEFIEEAKEAYDMVIFDSTPILSAADAAILGRKVDGVLLVYRVGAVSRGLLKRSTTQLEQVNCNIIGVVLNGMKPEISPDFQDYKHYSYYYSYGGPEGDKKEQGYKKRLTDLSKKLNGQETDEKTSDTNGGGGGSLEKREKKSNIMKLFSLFVALVLLAAGLLWQNGVVDPFAWIQPRLRAVKQDMNGSVKQKSLHATSSKKSGRITKNPKGTTSEKKRVTTRQTIPTKKPPVVKRVPKPSKKAAPKIEKAAKGEVSQKKVINAKRPEAKESKKRVVIRRKIAPPKSSSVEKKVIKPSADPFADPFKDTSPKAKGIDKVPAPKEPLIISKTETSGMNGKKPAPNRLASVRKVPAYPYSLYIGSFRTIKRANRAVSIYTKKGLRSAYKVKVFLSKGVWYRVYMGYFESREAADKFRRENELKETTVKKTQYANLIGTYSSTTTLENKIQSLKKLGFSPYVITDHGGEYRLFVGAFNPEARARTQYDELQSKGISSKIVKR
jgi:capsular exopolysaccharide synthesis family protein